MYVFICLFRDIWLEQNGECVSEASLLLVSELQVIKDMYIKRMYQIAKIDIIFITYTHNIWFPLSYNLYCP